MFDLTEKWFPKVSKLSFEFEDENTENQTVYKITYYQEMFTGFITKTKDEKYN